MVNIVILQIFNDHFLNILYLINICNWFYRQNLVTLTQNDWNEFKNFKIFHEKKR